MKCICRCFAFILLIHIVPSFAVCAIDKFPTGAMRRRTSLSQRHSITTGTGGAFCLMRQ
jgi:hypothetical protein